MATLAGLLSRRQLPYADIIRAEAPAAKQAYFNRLAQEQERKRIATESELAKKSLAQSAEQFDTSLTENKRQFAENQALQKKIAEQQAEQASQATGLSTIGLGIEAYPYLKKGASGLSDVLFSEPAAGAGSSSGAGASSTLGSAKIGGIVAGAILGQHALAGNTPTEFEGQKTGDFFTFDENGNWAPRFGNDPWHGFLNAQWGAGPSAGEKFDAAMYNGDVNELLRRTPAAVQQWTNPIGDFGYDIAESRFGPQFAGTLDPITYGFDRLAGASNIGEAAKGLVDTSAKIIDPGGNLAGNAVKEKVKDWTGNDALADVAQSFVDPVGTVSNFIGRWF